MTTAAADVPAPRILPRLDDRNRPFWTGGREGKLLILRHRGTGRWVHPPERVALDADHLTPQPVSGKGSIFTFTVNHHRYHPDVPVPYVIALVELDEQVGLRLPANIVNCPTEQVHIGMRVRVRFEDHGEVFVPVFEPDE
jgi:uncharacterized protein